MRAAIGIAMIVLGSASAADAVVVAETLPYQHTPDWSDVVFNGASMAIDGAESVLDTLPGLGVWFGWLSSQNPPGWSISDNVAGNYLSLTAKFNTGSADWYAYQSDGTHYIEMRFNPTPCDVTSQNCYLFGSTPGVELLFAGDQPNTANRQFIALDTTRYNRFEWLSQNGTVTYRINGASYSGAAVQSGGQRLLIVGDSSGSSLSGLGQMRISGISFDAGPAFSSLPNTVPEPQSWAMLIAGFGLVGAVMRRRRVATAA